MQAVARGVIWSVEVAPGSNTWEQYSFKLNAYLEDAYLRKLDRVRQSLMNPTAHIRFFAIRWTLQLINKKPVKLISRN